MQQNASRYEIGFSPAVAHLDCERFREHLLDDHLLDVGLLAEKFAEKFNSGAWGRAAGCWHDLGKYRLAFQKMICSAGDENTHLRDGINGRVDHSSVGAIYAQQVIPAAGMPLALVIAGHHAGLRNKSDWLERRFPEKKELIKDIHIDQVPEHIIEPPILKPPKFLRSGDKAELSRKMEFWIRMLFSSLVDADFLDTEDFYSPGQQQERGGFLSLHELNERLTRHLDELSGGAKPSPVNEIRKAVLQRCRDIADHPTGVFSLTVPTGGGKTYASLAFALEHALARGLDRVIVVAPFLTIIDQTVDAYRKALSVNEDLPFVEHHSGIEPEEESARNRLANENWDAPLVVTTSVQFFESLFARRTSQCRKLHNLARSVIVLDEAQTLPGDYLLPILDVLQELVDNYGSSLVLSTATQPEFHQRTHPDGRIIPGFREIVEINNILEESFVRLRRVRPERVATSDWDEIAALVAAEPRGLAITHLRQDARELAERVYLLRPGEPLIHLSALMCSRHRQEKIAAIKERLQGSGAIRVVSTQLVEAGVDLDFPVVFRAMAGFDALIQSAGRCNREGKPSMGRLVIFDAPTRPPTGWLRTAADRAIAMFNETPDLDLFCPDTYRNFDQSLHRVQDRHGIQPLREQMAYEDVADTFRLIDDGWQVGIVVPWGPVGNRNESVNLLEGAANMRHSHQLRKLARQLQPYTVNIPRRMADAWLKTGILRLVAGLFLALDPLFLHLYDQDFGLSITKEIPIVNPALLIG